jgi:ATP-dependent RNA helicase DDX54/DBP10
LSDGASSFAQQALGATFDLTGDEGAAERKRRQLNWDKKKKKFIKGDDIGANNMKLIRTENGTKLPATYRSGRFDEWKTKNKVNVPKIGEAEPDGLRRKATLGRRFKHKKVVAAKPLDKLSKDYDRKTRQMKKKEVETIGDLVSGGRKGTKASRRYGGKLMGAVETELKTTDQIRKGRKLLENRRAKNGRPSRTKNHRFKSR